MCSKLPISTPEIDFPTPLMNAMLFYFFFKLGAQPVSRVLDAEGGHMQGRRTSQLSCYEL